MIWPLQVLMVAQILTALSILMCVPFYILALRLTWIPMGRYLRNEYPLQRRIARRAEYRRVGILRVLLTSWMFPTGVGVVTMALSAPSASSQSYLFIAAALACALGTFSLFVLGYSLDTPSDDGGGGGGWGDGGGPDDLLAIDLTSMITTQVPGRSPSRPRTPV